MSIRRTNFFRDNEEDKEHIQMHELHTSSLKSSQTIYVKRESTINKRGYSMREPVKFNKFTSSLIDEQEVKIERPKETIYASVK